MIADLSLAEQAERVRQGELSAEACVRAALDRIEARDPVLRAFTHWMPDEALAAARAADRAAGAGTRLGPLHGVPYALKDIVDVAGMQTSANSHVMADYRAPRDADLVRRLREAGAILVGKLSTNEFACGGVPVDCPYPTPLNPWHAGRVTGGSSSGSAVSVAAGMVPLAIGTDTNGSIRNPASRCGTVGMKPTYGRVSRDGIFPLSPSQDHAGPLTRTVRDNAWALQCMAGFDPRDAASSREPVGDYLAGLEAGVAGLRIGVLAHLHEEDPLTDPAQRTAFDDTVAGLRAAGATPVPLRLPDADRYTDVARALLSAEAYAIHERWLAERGSRYGPGSRARLLQGAVMSAADYLRAQRVRARLCAQFDALLDGAGVDVVLTAACFDAVPRVDDVSALHLRHRAQALMIFNVTGMPALSMPTGRSADGLPLAVQIAGRAFGEALVYRVARAVERLRPALPVAMPDS